MHTASSDMREHVHVASVNNNVTDIHIFPHREVLASPLVLNVLHCIDWKVCATSKEEETETASAKSMRHNFQPYDFNS